MRERRSLHAEHGVTLVELLVAITVMMIVLAGVAASTTTGLQLARGNTNRIVAANVADEQIGEVRALDFAAIPQTTVTGTVTRGGMDYTWTRDAEMVYLGADDSCEAPSGAFNSQQMSYLRVIVTVSWPRMEGIDPVRSETIIDPPVADYDPYRGHLAVKVTDRDGAPVSGMTVYLRNADSATPALNTFEATDSDGCAFFDSLDVVPDETVGRYHVWVNRSGYVDRASGLTDTSAQSPQPVVNVVSAQLRKVEFNYDRAAFLNVALVGKFGGTPATGLPVTIANDNYNGGNGPVVFDSPSLLAATALHPFSAGFSLWGGRCTQADPGATDRTRLVTNPNQTTTGNVQMGTVEVTVRQRFAVAPINRALPGAIIEAQDACGNTYAATTAPTNSSGRAVIALPYGSWILRVQGRTVVSSWPSVTLAYNDGSQRTATVTVY